MVSKENLLLLLKEFKWEWDLAEAIAWMLEESDDIPQDSIDGTYEILKNVILKIRNKEAYENFKSARDNLQKVLMDENTENKAILKDLDDLENKLDELF